LSIGIITSDTNNNRLYYEVSQTYEHYPALSSIFGGKKFKANKKDKAGKDPADGIEAVDVEPVETIKDPFVADLLKTGNIRLAIYTGQFTRDDQSGVDILIVGDVNRAAVDNLVADLEISEKKDLRYSVFAPEEFKYRKQVNDRFISDILVSKKIVLIDKDKIL
jgi:hypothetical protein